MHSHTAPAASYERKKIDEQEEEDVEDSGEDEVPPSAFAEVQNQTEEAQSLRAASATFSQVEQPGQKFSMTRSSPQNEQASVDKSDVVEVGDEGGGDERSARAPALDSAEKRLLFSKTQTRTLGSEINRKLIKGRTRSKSTDEHSSALSQKTMTHEEAVREGGQTRNNLRHGLWLSQTIHAVYAPLGMVTMLCFEWYQLRMEGISIGYLSGLFDPRSREPFADEQDWSDYVQRRVLAQNGDVRTVCPDLEYQLRERWAFSTFLRVLYVHGALVTGAVFAVLNIVIECQTRFGAAKSQTLEAQRAILEMFDPEDEADPRELRASERTPSEIIKPRLSAKSTRSTVVLLPRGGISKRVKNQVSRRRHNSSTLLAGNEQEGEARDHEDDHASGSSVVVQVDLEKTALIKEGSWSYWLPCLCFTAEILTIAMAFALPGMVCFERIISSWGTTGVTSKGGARTIGSLVNRWYYYARTNLFPYM